MGLEAQPGAAMWRIEVAWTACLAASLEVSFPFTVGGIKISSEAARQAGQPVLVYHFDAMPCNASIVWWLIRQDVPMRLRPSLT